MLLDREIEKSLKTFIEEDLKLTEPPKDIAITRLRKIWKIEGSEYEFLYGEKIGFFTGIGTGMVFHKFKRAVSSEETDQIFDIVESYASKIRDYLARYKASR